MIGLHSLTFFFALVQMASDERLRCLCVMPGRWLWVFWGLIFASQRINSVVKQLIVMPGATGYIGRAVVKELSRSDNSCVALVRSLNSISASTAPYLSDANVIQCDVTNPEAVRQLYQQLMPTSTICCLASRSGVRRDSWLVDRDATINVLAAQETVTMSRCRVQQSVKAFSSNQSFRTSDGNSSSAISSRFVLLSAYCVGKPRLQFQFAKLEAEQRLRASQSLTSYSIVRPTAFFKSIDGQWSTIRRGWPAIYFGDGQCAANAIAAEDLASFLVRCALSPESIHMVNASRNLGGPDWPPIPKRQQLEMLFEALQIPQSNRRFISLPIGLLTGVISLFDGMSKLLPHFPSPEYWADLAEIARIVHYYATEPMVTAEGKPEEIWGQVHLLDYLQVLTRRLIEIKFGTETVIEEDKMTSTTGILSSLFTQKIKVGQD